MRVFAISDLHLSLDSQGQTTKPMAVFGPEWADHIQRLADNWRQVVGEADTVLIPGDISWAMNLAGAAWDLAWLAALPGRKILLRGNHDYWWDSIGKVRQRLPAGIAALQNDCVALDGLAVCGARGWLSPGSEGADTHDLKLFQREVGRLALSLRAAPPAAEILVMLHFPPTDSTCTPNAMIELLQAYGVKRCIYGHLHGQGRQWALPAEKWGIAFQLVSADHVGFAPVLIQP